MATSKLVRNPRYALLTAIFVIYAASTIIWTAQDETPPPWDPADHLSVAYDYYYRLAQGDISGFAQDFFSGTHYYAPLFHLTTALAFILFGVSRSAALCVNLLSLAILLLSVEWIARKLYPPQDTHHSGPRTGSADRENTSKINFVSIAAALLAASYHFSAWLLNYAFLDYALMAVTAGAFAALIRAGDFGNRRDALRFGLVAGLGLLTKQTFPFFFVLPGVYVAAKVIGSRDKTARSNLLLSVALMIAIAAIWYAPHFADLVAIFKINLRAAAAEGEAPIFSLRSAIYYVRGLLGAQIQLPLAALFLCGLLHFFRHRRKASLILYLWILSGVGVFTLLPNKDLRYTVPVLPAVAILSLSWVGDLTPGKRRQAVTAVAETSHLKAAPGRPPTYAKRAVIAAVTIWSFLSFFNAQWPQGTDPQARDGAHLRWLGLRVNYYQFDRRPVDDDWGIYAIVSTVADSWSKTPDQVDSSSPPESPVDLPLRKDDRPTLGVIVNLPYLNPSSVALYSRLLTGRKAALPPVSVEWIVSEAVLSRIDDCDYLLVRTGLENADRVSPVEIEVERMIQSDPGRFTMVDHFPLPQSDAAAVLYKLQRRASTVSLSRSVGVD